MINQSTRTMTGPGARRAVMLILCLLTLGGRAGAQPFMPNEVATVVSGGVFEAAPPFSDYALIQTIELVAGRLQMRVGDTLDAQRVSDAVSYNDTVYFATSQGVIAIKAGSMAKLARRNDLPGVRRLLATRNHLYVTRGAGAPAGAAPVIRLDRRTLQTTAEATNLTRNAEHLIEYFGTIAVGVPGAVDGSVAFLDTTTGQVLSEVNLGADGVRVGRLVEIDDSLMAFSQLAPGSQTGVITVFRPDRTVSRRIPTNYSIGEVFFSASGLVVGQIGTTGVGYVMPGMTPIIVTGRPSARGALFADVTSQTTYVLITTADLTGPSQGILYSVQGAKLDSVTLAPAPEALTITPRAPTRVRPGSSASPTVRLWPQPARRGGIIYLEYEGVGLTGGQGAPATAPVTMTDATGISRRLTARQVTPTATSYPSRACRRAYICSRPPARGRGRCGSLWQGPGASRRAPPEPAIGGPPAGRSP